MPAQDTTVKPGKPKSGVSVEPSRKPNPYQISRGGNVRGPDPTASQRATNVRGPATGMPLGPPTGRNIRGVQSPKQIQPVTKPAVPNVRPGLIEKDIVFHRGGKTFIERRMVRPDEGAPQEGAKTVADAPSKDAPSKDAPSNIEKKQGEDNHEMLDDEKHVETPVEMTPEHKEELNKHVEEAKDMEPGEIKKIGKAKVRSFGNNVFGLRVLGKNIVVHGLRGLSLLVDKIGSLSSTGGALMIGDIRGATVQQGIGAQQLERGAEQKVGEVKRTSEQMKRVKEAHDKIDAKHDAAIKRIEESRKKAHENLDKQSGEVGLGERLQDYLGTREEFDRQRAIKDAYMKQKRQLIADDTARKVKLNKLDSMSDNQVVNLAVRMSLPVHDEFGNMHDIKDIREAVRNRAMESQRKLPKEKAELVIDNPEDLQGEQGEKAKQTLMEDAHTIVDAGKEAEEIVSEMSKTQPGIPDEAKTQPDILMKPEPIEEGAKTEPDIIRSQESLDFDLAYDKSNMNPSDVLGSDTVPESALAKKIEFEGKKSKAKAMEEDGEKKSEKRKKEAEAESKRKETKRGPYQRSQRSQDLVESLYEAGKTVQDKKKSHETKINVAKHREIEKRKAERAEKRKSKEETKTIPDILTKNE